MCSTDPEQAEGREYGEVAAEPVLPSTSSGEPRYVVAARGAACQPEGSGPCSYIPRLGKRGGAFGAGGTHLYTGGLYYQDVGKALRWSDPGEHGPGTQRPWDEPDQLRRHESSGSPTS